VKILIQIYFLCLLLPAAVQAQFTYTTNDNNTITITGYTGDGGDVSIPDTINGLPVTSIGTLAFVSASVTNVTIPDSVLFIENGAFMDCESLNNVALGNGVSYIGDYAFEFCFSLTQLIIPTNVVSIGDWTFGECDSLTSVTIPNSVTNIGLPTFGRDNSLTNILVAALNPTYASYSGVLYDKNLTLLIQFPGGKGGCYTVPDGVTMVGEAAFNANPYLNSVVIPNSVTNIGDTAFIYCGSLTNVVFGNGLINIGENAFAYCNFADVTIPNSVINIDDNAFDHCSSLAHITLGNSLIMIGPAAFNWCVSLSSVIIPNSVKDITLAFVHCSSLTNVTIPQGISSIGVQAFWQCGNLKSVIIPDSVTNIGNSAFEDTGLTSVFFEGNAPFVDLYAFSDDLATAYYLPGTTGWSDFVAQAGIPVELWLPQAQTSDSSFGVRTNQFGFNINWASGQTVVVEASTNLVDWQPVQTNMLTTGSAYFSDLKWTNYSSRFYRLRSQ
jgi:hypothetical protein